jgi:hypothetical protein
VKFIARRVGRERPIARLGLDERGGVRRAVHRGRRREHEVPDARIARRIEQRDAALHVHREVLVRRADRRSHARERGEVEDRVERFFRAQLSNERGVANIAFDQLEPRAPQLERSA